LRHYTQPIDQYLHNSCTTLTLATAYRLWFAGLSAEEIDQKLAKAPSKQRTEYKRDVALHGLDSKYVRDAVAYHRKLLEMMDTSLARGPWAVGETFSLADAAVIPYMLRLELLRLHRRWDRLPRIDACCERMRSHA